MWHRVKYHTGLTAVLSCYMMQYTQIYQFVWEPNNMCYNTPPSWWFLLLLPHNLFSTTNIAEPVRDGHKMAHVSWVVLIKSSSIHLDSCIIKVFLLFMSWPSWVGCSSGLLEMLQFSPSEVLHSTINHDAIEFEWVEPGIVSLSSVNYSDCEKTHGCCMNGN